MEALAAQFSGDLSLSTSASSNNLSGNVSVTDPDANEASVTAQNQTSLNYGTFTITSNGASTYAVNTQNATLIALPEGQSLSDSVTISSVDGTSTDITITINGAQRVGPTTLVKGSIGGNDQVPLVNSTMLAEKSSVYENLPEDDEAEDSFKPDTLVFNSGNNRSVTIFAQYQSTIGDDIRIDQFSVSSSGAPDPDARAFFDEFRLVSHPELP